MLGRVGRLGVPICRADQQARREQAYRRVFHFVSKGLEQLQFDKLPRIALDVSGIASRMLFHLAAERSSLLAVF